MGRIRVGTASWTDATLIKSGWYPGTTHTAEARLAYYAGQFPIVEVDSTYYAPPSGSTATLWAQRTGKGFVFDIKAFSLFTGHPTKPGALPADLRPATDKTSIYRGDLDPGAFDDVWSRFLSALRPLFDAGKLGILLFQFPPWFSIKKSNKQYVAEMAHRCAPYQCAVELRHPSWLTEENQRETFDFLTTHGISFVGVDMPQGLPTSVPPVLRATAEPAVVRLHGHSDKWTSRDIHEKYGYRYADRELKTWAGKVRRLAAAGETHVLFNNCYQDFAQRNASRFAHLLG